MIFCLGVDILFAFFFVRWHPCILLPFKDMPLFIFQCGASKIQDRPIHVIECYLLNDVINLRVGWKASGPIIAWIVYSSILNTRISRPNVPCKYVYTVGSCSKEIPPLNSSKAKAIASGLEQQYCYTCGVQSWSIGELAFWSMLGRCVWQVISHVTCRWPRMLSW